MQHKHHDLIVAWAKGAEIQYLSDKGWWLDAAWSPSWRETTAYRIKPEPKPDVVLYGMIKQDEDYMNVARIKPVNANTQLRHTDTCMFIFDGETGALKDAQVLASSAE